MGAQARFMSHALCGVRCAVVEFASRIFTSGGRLLVPCLPGLQFVSLATCIAPFRPGHLRPFDYRCSVLLTGGCSLPTGCNRLMLAYLCGPIEFAADGGKLWRRKLAPFLRETLGHRVYDPAEDEKKNLTEEEAASFREWKATDLDRFRREIGVMKNEFTGNLAAPAKTRWNGHVKSGGHPVREVVNRQGGVVGEDPLRDVMAIA